MKEGQICEVFGLIAELGSLRGLRSIKDTPGLTSIKIDDRWLVKLNPHEKTIDHVLPYHAYVEYNGWPAGLFDAGGGCIAAGECANEGALIKAIRKAIRHEKIPMAKKAKV